MDTYVIYLEDNCMQNFRGDISSDIRLEVLVSDGVLQNIL